MQSNILLLSTFVASVSATVNVYAALEARNGVRADLVPRQTLDAKCQSILVSIGKSVPTAPPKLASELIAHPQTDPCHFTPPAGLDSEFSSYSSELVSWAEKNKDILNECAELSRFQDITADCSGAVASKTSATTTATTSSTNTASTSSTTTNTETTTSSSTTSTNTGSTTSSTTGTSTGTTTTTTSRTTTTSSSAIQAGAARETAMALAAMAAAGLAMAL
ncbi:hypothetical protein DCS_04424 [Drechmeria coniospora]|uniref:Infection structure specific protein n=1 Tax=Drechmeria coniospora TaxID=98403 RepID=A0A151GJX8_DRECN|nr:hypothetical protein DCS_04424 [Drechmeria coniospora]KYK57415.1 hypothetical protein DCS_04424 [Drechmeria coniospora]ODA79317.1 hypothetical protein RJ55_04910 [Drechmeria coniospora]